MEKEYEGKQFSAAMESLSITFHWFQEAHFFSHFHIFEIGMYSDCLTITVGWSCHCLSMYFKTQQSGLIGLDKALETLEEYIFKK
jgi:hypothetical protein